jgi:hypothetical protein
MIPRIKLREKDINKLSGITQIPTETLQKLEAMNLLDEMEVRNLLILTDWRALKRGKRYNTTQIVGALVNEYQVSKSKVENIIYAKRKSQYWCRQCEKRILKSEHQRNSGICDKCVIQSIKL